MAASKLPTYYGSGRSTSHLVGVLTKGGALKAGKQFLTSDLKEAGFSVGVFESPDGYYVINIGKTMKKNPAPKRKTAARTQRAAESYVRRPSQITKKAPSKRLKKRRTVNLQSPRGVFPNPKTRSSLEKTSSWVIRNKKTGEVIMETFDIKKVNALNTAKYEAVPILKYLQELNSGIKKNPSSVHFDIDVNSHNARGAKAKTRVNPVARKKIAGLKNFIIQESAFSDTTGFKTVAVFAKVDESFEYAKARDAKNRSEGKRRWIKVLEG